MRALFTLIFLVALVTTLHAIRIYQKNKNTQSLFFSHEKEASAATEKDSLNPIDFFIRREPSIELK